MKTKFKLFGLLVALLFFKSGIQAQQYADCNNIYLDRDTFYLIYPQDTVVSGNLFYFDTVMTVYPTLHLLLSDTTVITSPDAMVLSFLVNPDDTMEAFNFNIHFKNSSFANNTIVSGHFHIFDSDVPGDSTVTCYMPITLILQTVTGLEKQALPLPDFRIYPNPASGFLNLESTAGSVLTEIRLTTLAGRQVFFQHAIMDKSQIDLSELPSGIYFLQINTENGNLRRKVVKY